jgi:mono/diheme cytochrome c family protein
MPTISSVILHVQAARRFFTCIAACALLAVCGPARAAEPALELNFHHQQQRITRAQLLQRAELRTIAIPADSAYKRAMTYRALPLLSILPDLHGVDTVQFKAEDGFVANIPAQRLSGGAQPWLAIEPPDAPWPPVKAGGRSAGPFYLVWLAPEKSGITPELWPYQLAAIGEITPLQSRYPQILPAPSVPAASAIYRGMQVYVTNCAVCHQINGGGDASLGPDLNLPFSPTEYFQPAFLRRYIRNPAAVRHWPHMTMPSFPATVISDTQLDELIAYLRHMSARK